MPQATARPRDGGDQVADAVRAALAVPGVAAVRVEPDSADGLALLRLELVPGADSDDVAKAVDAHLRRDLGTVPPTASAATQPVHHAAPAAGRVTHDDGEPLAVVTSGRLPQIHRPVATAGDQTQLRTARGAQAHAVRPRPWEALPIVLPDDQPAGRAPELGRLGLDRVQVMTRGLDVTATVVLTDDGRQHTGVCEAAATPGGHHRSLAGATAQALESAAGGRCRLEVEAADITTVAGEETAVVVLSILSARGSQKLTGACPVGDDPQRAVVKAVLAASNRRMSLQLADR